MRTRSTMLALLAAVTGLLAACGWGGSDKAGGVSTPVTLRIAAHKEHDYFATLFTDEVRRLSKGRIRVEFIPGNGDNDPADALVRFARQVRTAATTSASSRRRRGTSSVSGAWSRSRRHF